MFVKIFYASLFIAFATASPTPVNTINTKAEFAEKFVNVLRPEIISLNARAVGYRVTFLSNLFSIVGPNFKYAAKLQERIDELKRFGKDLVEKTYTDEEVVALINFVDVYAGFKDLEDWEKEGLVSKETLEKAGLDKQMTDLEQNYNIIATNMKNAWVQLYGEASAELLKDHKEYAEINDIFNAMDDKEPTKMPYLDRALVIAYKFFDLKAWEKLIDEDE